MSVLDNVAVARQSFGNAGLARSLASGWTDAAWATARSHAMYLLEALGVADVAQTPAGGLPYGLKRKVEIARALALEPALLLLDEPAAGLNEAEQLDLAERLRVFASAGLSILVIEHNMPFLMPLAERIVCLDHGEVIAEGTPAEIRANAAVIEAYLGIRGRAAAIVSDPLFEIDGVVARYGQIEALHGVSLTVGEGEAVALVGANGAGKSTLMKCVMGLLGCAAGAMRFEGHGHLQTSGTSNAPPSASGIRRKGDGSSRA